MLTNGALERDLLERADAFVAVGLDEEWSFLPRPWTYTQPTIRLSARQLESALQRSDWEAAEVKQSAEAQRQRMRVACEGDGILPYRVVEVAAEVYAGARATVDAGAHMFPVMSLWPAEEPCGVLISNGLSTMGFALPAAIGAALLDSARPVVTFTGDGGILMCLGELGTAARAESLRLRIVVFDDGELSLIKVKQVRRGYLDGRRDDGGNRLGFGGRGSGSDGATGRDRRGIARLPA